MAETLIVPDTRGVDDCARWGHWLWYVELEMMVRLCECVCTHHVQRSLVAGTICKNALTIDMPTDVFKFLFHGNCRHQKRLHWS